MSSETIVTGIYLIAAVIAASIMVGAIFPTIYSTADTFTSLSASADENIRTDIRIVNTYADSSDNTVKVWLKNVGTASIMLENSDIFVGPVGNFERQSLAGNYVIEGSSDDIWNPAETLTVTCTSSNPLSEGGSVYFSFVLPNGVKRTQEFTAD